MNLPPQRWLQPLRWLGYETKSSQREGAGMVQWWESSPLTNVSRVRFPDPASYMGWVCCWFSTLVREVFRLVFPLSLKTNISKFQFDPGIHGHFNILWNEFLWTPWYSVGKQITFIFTFFTPAIVATTIVSTNERVVYIWSERLQYVFINFIAGRRLRK